MQTIEHSIGHAHPVASRGNATKEAAIKRVLLADDDPLVRTAVTLLFSQQKGFEVVGEAKNGEEAIVMASQLQPDLLVLDQNMPYKAGLQALRDLGPRLPDMRTILLTVAIEKRQILEALQLGARGIMLKASANPLLLSAVKTVLRGGYWLDRHEVANISAVVEELRGSCQHSNDATPALTPRELQIVGYIVEGATNKDIARNLQTSEQVIKNHLGRIFDKLGVFNRLELALYALDHNLAGRSR